MKVEPFSVETPEQSPGYLLWQTTMIWQRLIKNALAPFHITHPQFVILAVLLWHTQDHNVLIQTDIIKHTQLDKMTVSKGLKNLVSKALIMRHEHTDDTRAKVVSLTATGQALIKKLVPIVEDIDRNFFAAIKQEHQPVILSLLQRLVAKNKNSTV